MREDVIPEKVLRPWSIDPEGEAECDAAVQDLQRTIALTSTIQDGPVEMKAQPEASAGLLDVRPLGEMYYEYWLSHRRGGEAGIGDSADTGAAAPAVAEDPEIAGLLEALEEKHAEEEGGENPPGSAGGEEDGCCGCGDSGAAIDGEENGSGNSGHADDLKAANATGNNRNQEAEAVRFDLSASQLPAASYERRQAGTAHSVISAASHASDASRISRLTGRAFLVQRLQLEAAARPVTAGDTAASRSADDAAELASVTGGSRSIAKVKRDLETIRMSDAALRKMAYLRRPRGAKWLSRDPLLFGEQLPGTLTAGGAAAAAAAGAAGSSALSSRLALDVRKGPPGLLTLAALHEHERQTMPTGSVAAATAARAAGGVVAGAAAKTPSERQVTLGRTMATAAMAARGSDGPSLRLVRKSFSVPELGFGACNGGSGGAGCGRPGDEDARLPAVAPAHGGATSGTSQYHKARTMIAAMKKLNTRDSTTALLQNTQGMSDATKRRECWMSEARRGLALAEDPDYKEEVRRSPLFPEHHIQMSEARAWVEEAIRLNFKLYESGTLRPTKGA